jgi:hypothetical protein
MSKGQMVFEFILAAVLFMGIVIFVLNIINSNVAVFTGDYFSYSLENKAVAASESLVKLSGGIGLAEKWPVLNSTKISALNYTCSFPENYTVLLMDLNLFDKPSFGTYNVRIVVNESVSGNTLLDCKPPAGAGLPGNLGFAHVKRFGVADNRTVEINVWIW